MPESSRARWSKEEEQHLVELRNAKKASWNDIASILGRGVRGVRLRYTKIRAESQLLNGFAWTLELDKQLIDGRLKGDTIRQVAGKMKLPRRTVSKRLEWLRKNNRVSKKIRNPLKPSHSSKPWTEEEDEILCRLYIAMCDDKEIHRLAKFPGKSLHEVQYRRGFHENGTGVGYPRTSDMYSKLMQLHMRMPWTKQDVLDLNFDFGQWRPLNRMA